MATIKQVKNELRNKGWAEEIAECQSSGMRISEWCHMKGINCNTYTIIYCKTSKSVI